VVLSITLLPLSPLLPASAAAAGFVDKATAQIQKGLVTGIMAIGENQVAIIAQQKHLLAQQQLMATNLQMLLQQHAAGSHHSTQQSSNRDPTLSLVNFKNFME
jgi:hypothetical protein